MSHADKLLWDQISELTTERDQLKQDKEVLERKLAVMREQLVAAEREVRLHLDNLAKALDLMSQQNDGESQPLFSCLRGRRVQAPGPVFD